jgi:hypothetical protein
VREDVKHAPHVRAFVDGLAAHMFATRGLHLGQLAASIARGNMLGALALGALFELAGSSEWALATGLA